MLISKKTQLGLQIDSPYELADFFDHALSCKRQYVDALDRVSEKIKQNKRDGEESFTVSFDESDQKDLEVYRILQNQTNWVGEKGKPEWLIEVEDKNFDRPTHISIGRVFLITSGVKEPAKMIKMNGGFTSTMLRNMKHGRYTYLLGKDEVCQFTVEGKSIGGYFWNKANKECFTFLLDLYNNGIHFNEIFTESFERIIQIITFIELGDIEVIELEGGRNNGKTNKQGKITNGGDCKVYVVDSSWNQLIIRTTGFAVKGHFRLQPCGVGMFDRKLIWISAFEKHGYVRRPKGEIVE